MHVPENVASQKVGICDLSVATTESLVCTLTPRKIRQGNKREGRECNITLRDWYSNMARKFVTVSFVKLENLGGMFAVWR